MIRTGRKNGHTVYRQDGPAPSDDDEFLGAFGDPEMAAVVVDRYNDFQELSVRTLRLETEAAVMRRQIGAYREQIQRLQAIKEPVVMSDGDKRDTEAAFQRGVEHARNAMGQDTYTRNRAGIKLLGRIADEISKVQHLLGDAVTELSTDDPAEDNREKSTAALYGVTPTATD